MRRRAILAAALLIRRVRSRDIGLSVVLALQVAIMFVVAPLAATGKLPLLLVETFRLGLAAAAVVLLTRNRMASTLIVATFVVSLLLSAAMRSGMAATAVDLGRLAATTAFDLAVATAVAQVAFGEGRVSVHRILGAVILYLSVGLIFANAYRAAAMLLHPSFSGLVQGRGDNFSPLLYFSLSTLTTTGFGDITPVHPFVRSLANLEAVFGQLFPATLLARLVTLHATGERVGHPDGEV